MTFARRLAGCSLAIAAMAFAACGSTSDTDVAGSPEAGSPPEGGLGGTFVGVPCTTDAECGLGGHCINLGGVSFCSVSCNSTADCPAGATCEKHHVGEFDQNVCVPNTIADASMPEAAAMPDATPADARSPLDAADAAPDALLPDGALACTGSWQPLGSTLRYNHEAIVAGGKIFVWGGYDGYGTSLTTGALVDPATLAWSALPTTNAPVTTAASPLAYADTSGTVLVLASSAAASRRFNVASQTWSTVNATGFFYPSQPLLVDAGSRVFVWDQATAQGALYDTALDTWTALPATNAPTTPCCGGGAWTGSEVVLWGGTGDAAAAQSNAGWRFNVGTNTWATMTATGAPTSRGLATVAWTGSQVIVWGGYSPAVGNQSSGARYNPGTNTWSPMATSGAFAPGANSNVTVGMVGGKMVALPSHASPALAGSVYDPTADSWTPASTTGSPRDREGYTVSFTGADAIVLRGVPDGAPALSFQQGADYKYNVAGNSWSSDGIDEPPFVGSHGGSSGGSASLVWADGIGRALLWSPGEGVFQGGAFNPTTRTWSRIAMTNAPTETWYNYYAASAWTGTQMLTFGGTFDNQPGATYAPAGDTWTRWPASASAPTPRTEPVLVWTGGANGKLFAWSSADYWYASSNTGAVFDPTGGNWTPTTTTGAPSPRISLSTRGVAIGGSKLAIWGGTYYDNVTHALVYRGDGAIYDVAADTWTPMSGVGAPSARAYHAAVWTGTSLLVWGGSDATHSYFADGARYDPATDTWTPMSATSASSGGAFPLGVWTGSTAIFWGAGGKNTGGIYDPVTDSWRCMNTTNAPKGPARALGVWTGSQVFVYAGSNDGANTGGLFTP